jgi:hypothetical protein
MRKKSSPPLTSSANAGGTMLAVNVIVAESGIVNHQVTGCLDLRR